MNPLPIDTLRVRFSVDPSKICLVGWTHNKKSCQGKIIDFLIFEEFTMSHTCSNGTAMRLVYRPCDRYDSSLNNSLYVEFSLPKLVFGCNHRMIDDSRHAKDIANSELARIPGLPNLKDIRDAPLYRLDLPYNFQVGRNAPYYIGPLCKAHWPKRDTLPYKNNGKNYNGIVYKPPKGGISFSIYDKYKECGCPDAWGILRIEISMRRKPIITKIFGKSDFTLRDLTYDAAMMLFRNDLVKLHLDQDIVGEQIELDRRLHEVFSPRKVRSLLGYLLEKQSKTYEQIITGGTSRKSICYFEKLLKKAGISSLSIEEKMILPALLPLLCAEGRMGNKVLSDTKV